MIGVDPHKGSHTAVALDSDERVLAELKVHADRHQTERLLAWAAPFQARTWAIEGAGGLGYLLAQQLIAAGELVVDVPATLSARVRLLGCGKAGKNDPNDARSAAVAGLRHTGLRVVAREDHPTVLRLLVDRHHNLTALRTQAVCRLHALLCALAPGGLGRKLSAARAADLLRTIRPTSQVQIERKALAQELLGDVRKLDTQLAASKARIQVAVAASGTSVIEVYGVGPIVAAFLIGHTGDIRRFRSKDHYASYNATAPIEASSGPRVRHRLNPAGNRQLNHALHMAAVTQVRNDTLGRAYYQRKLAQGKGKKEALRALKRRVSDAVYRQLTLDANNC
jgi:transposase